MATAGEFIIRKEAADKLGASTLAAINAADMYNAGGYISSGGWGHYQGGGLVAGSNASNITPTQKAGGGGAAPITVATTINLSGGISGQSQRTGQGAGGGMTPDDAAKFQAVIDSKIRETIAREKRPGGTLNPNSR